ncbi:hypothetical protein SprV_0501911700 [Sparganum proliferum]
MDTEDPGPFQNFRVGDPVSPSHLRYSAKALEMEVVEFLDMAGADGPGVRTVEIFRLDNGLVNLQFGIHLNAVAIPHGVLQPPEGLAGFEDPVSHLFVDSDAARHCAV